MPRNFSFKTQLCHFNLILSDKCLTLWLALQTYRTSYMIVLQLVGSTYIVF